MGFLSIIKPFALIMTALINHFVEPLTPVPEWGWNEVERTHPCAVSVRER